MSNASQTLRVAGVEITTDAEGRFNLNALHRASLEGETKRPSIWLATKQAEELVDALSQNSGFEVIQSVRGGNAPGTFAHELLAVSYAGWISPVFQLQVNQTFIDYRSGRLQPSIPQTLPEALRLAADLAEEVADLKPKAIALERFANHEGQHNVRNAAKLLGVRERVFITWMIAHNWLFRDHSGRLCAKSGRLADGCLDTVPVDIRRSDGTHTVPQPVVTQKGIARLAVLLARDGLVPKKDEAA